MGFVLTEGFRRRYANTDGQPARRDFAIGKDDVMSYAPIPMVPGPTTLHPDVLAAMGKDYGSGRIEDDFIPLYRDTARKVARVFGTGNTVALMTGEGMAGLWGALKSCLVPGDGVVAVGTGVFGDGIGQMAASFGCRVESVSLPYTSTINREEALDRIEDAVRRSRPKMITAVHCETPSGTLNPLDALGEIKRRRRVPLLYVDAVASAGGAPVDADKHGVDLILGGSQKCFSAPPSMTMVGVSEEAFAIMEKADYQGYDALLPFRKAEEDGSCPYTPYFHGIAALNAAADVLLREGLDVVYARHREVAEQCRNGLETLGIRLFPDQDAVQSPTVTAALVPEGFTWPEWQKALRQRGLVATGSLGPLAGKVFRLGHMGEQAKPELMDKALAAIKDSLARR